MPRSAASPHAVTFLMVTLFLDTLGFGLIIPVLPGLIRQLTGTSIADAASWGGALMFIYAAMQFLLAPLLGNLSDRFGRRPVLLVSLATLAVDYLLMGLAPTITLLFVGRLLSGASSATYATANAYIADVTEEAERAGQYGKIGAAWGLGFVIGPALGGLLGELGLRVPFFAAAGLAIVNLLYGLLVLPETLTAERRRPFELARANPVGAFRAVRREPLVAALFFGLALYFLAHDVYPTTWSYFVIHRFEWSPAEIGLVLGAFGVTTALVSGLLVSPIVTRIGEMRAMFLGLTTCALGYYGHAFVPEGWMLLPCIAVGAFAGLVMPCLRGILSRHFPPNARGEMEGAIASLISLVAIISPPVMTQTFRFFSAPNPTLYFPGASFFLAGTLVVLAMGWFVITLSQAAPTTAKPGADQA